MFGDELKWIIDLKNYKVHFRGGGVVPVVILVTKELFSSTSTPSHFSVLYFKAPKNPPTF